MHGSTRHLQHNSTSLASAVCRQYLRGVPFKRGGSCRYIYGMHINGAFGFETASPNVTPDTLPDILTLGTTPSLVGQ